MKNVLLVIMDGWGIADSGQNNAIWSAKTPNVDNLLKTYSNAVLEASGEAVGLPAGQMGNSEVGHMNIGAGRVVYQDLTYINKCISDGTFFENEILINAIKKSVSKNSTLHLMGLLSDGGVHSNIDHLFALLKIAKQNGAQDVCVHIWSDGRDVPPKSVLNYVAKLNVFMAKHKIGRIATLCGRFYAMDRDGNTDRTTKAFDAIFSAKGDKITSITDAINNFYNNNVTDEFFTPCVMQNYTGAGADDVFICYNYRSDRVRQISKMFLESNLAEKYICFTHYENSIPIKNTAFAPRKIKNSLGEYVSKSGLTQFRIAETEKYAHVTFFFNGGQEEQYKGEFRKIVASPKVETYDLTPEMSAIKVTTEAVNAINSKEYNLIVVNFANSDMVGHTGNLQATIKAVETVDDCLGKLVKAAKETGMAVIVTADHGNAEKMCDENGNPFTSHTSNKVPFVAVDCCNNLKSDGALCDIAPTILEILGLPQPEEMTGESLIV